jgi:hypothetical protein
MERTGNRTGQAKIGSEYAREWFSKQIRNSQKKVQGTGTGHGTFQEKELARH